MTDISIQTCPLQPLFLSSIAKNCVCVTTPIQMYGAGTLTEVYTQGIPGPVSPGAVAAAKN